jgi:UDP-N-acetylglucosamine enolpyruvyl transferase
MNSAITIDDLLEQLEQARQIAIEDRKPAAAITATMSAARLLALDKPMIDVTPYGQDVQTISELMDELAADDQLLSQRISHVKNEY